MTNEQINSAIGEGSAEFARQRIQRLQAERDEARAELARLLAAVNDMDGLIDNVLAYYYDWCKDDELPRYHKEMAEQVRAHLLRHAGYPNVEVQS